MHDTDGAGQGEKKLEEKFTIEMQERREARLGQSGGRGGSGLSSQNLVDQRRRKRGATGRLVFGFWMDGSGGES